MLADIATSLSSPLVHSTLMFVLLRFACLFSTSKLLSFFSFLPLGWLLLCSMTYPSVILIKHLEDPYPTIKIESKVWRQTDAIVILACNYVEDDDLPFVSRWPNCSMQRNHYASQMYHSVNKPIYLAGGILGRRDVYSQAAHNQEFLTTMGVNSHDIFINSKGNNTETEVAALAEMLDGKYISLVTSASHLTRAITYFEDYNIKVLPIPVEHLSRKNVEPVLGLPNASSLYRSERALHEYLGLIYQNYLR
ncbi:YdcF family protein [uncultured Paraglaciecola sp.]|uniref:YdcF family protein n=1 Tax=uncultured Paraglaciecola sp. TaxID=1765024 RepID=UPI00259A8CFC|nr:YdcF family protein [uncultured Paraglaciecola sp.]